MGSTVCMHEVMASRAREILISIPPRYDAHEVRATERFCLFRLTPAHATDRGVVSAAATRQLHKRPRTQELRKCDLPDR